MKVSFLFPVLPPTIDGIGDHTARLAQALQNRCSVSILTAADNPDPVPGVNVRSIFSTDVRSSLRSVAADVESERPDWLVLQYNPFSYGTWGWNPYLVFTLRDALRRAPRTKLAMVVHEPFLPMDSWRWAVMTTWQRWQFWSLGRMADVLFFSTAPWAERFQRWFHRTPVYHLPVGSNISALRGDPAVVSARVRAELGIAPDTFVAGVFGSGHPSRLLPFVRAATERLHLQCPSLQVLYIGTAGVKVQSALGSIPVVDAGSLPADDVARHFAAMDLYLAPFRKGVSTRRGSFLVGLQQGVATVSTHGIHTDSMLRASTPTAFLLAPDDAPDAYAKLALRLGSDSLERAAVAQAGAELFARTFTWEAISNRFLRLLPSSLSAATA